MKSLVLITFFVTCIGVAQTHDEFSKILTKFVSDDGWVNYNDLSKNKQQLSDYLDYLSKNKPNEKASREDKISFYINLYNASTLYLVVEHYPVKSIKDIGGLLQSPFKKKFIQLGSRELSLDDVEKGILIPMKEPRIHFAINCASYSCPRLLNTAFEASTLETQLEQVTTDFIRSSENKIQAANVQLSKIFQWYKSDFENNEGSLIDFLNKYSTIRIKADASITYLPYRWDLNEK